MRAYSIDLRERVLAALVRGMPRSEAVTTFGVSLASIKRWVARQRAGQSLLPGRSSGRSRSLLESDLVLLRARLTDQPDATLDSHLHWWNQHYPDRSLSRATLDRAITRLNWTRKKRHFRHKSKTPTSEPLSAND